MMICKLQLSTLLLALTFNRYSRTSTECDLVWSPPWHISLSFHKNRILLFYSILRSTIPVTWCSDLTRTPSSMSSSWDSWTWELRTFLELGSEKLELSWGREILGFSELWEEDSCLAPDEELLESDWHNPRTLSFSATARKELRWSCLTLTSPWYMKSRIAVKSRGRTSWKIEI